MAELDDDNKDVKAARKDMQDAIDNFMRVINDQLGTQYMATHWILMVQGVLMDDPKIHVTWREPSQPPPSHTTQLGLLHHGILRLGMEVTQDDE